MIYLDKNTILTPAILNKLIDKFLYNEKLKLTKWENYFKGKHAILHKCYTDGNKHCNHIVTNFCKVIAETYSGYICGKPITYTSNEDITAIQDVLNYNDSEAEDMDFITNALVYGVAYELYWLDAYAQVRYAQIDPLSCFAIYDGTLDNELSYFVRWYKNNTLDESDLYTIEVYDKSTKQTFKSHGLGGVLEPLGEIEPHHFGSVPVSVFYLNNNEESIFNAIVSLNDAYNELQSSEIDDFNAWVDAYLVLKGVDADSEDLAAMRANRALVLPEGASAEWLTKNASDTQIVNMLENIKKNIYKITACPDMADETFLAQSGTALAYKLVGFENVASAIVARFTKALQKRIELICNILQIKATDAIWRDVNINFTRNLPINLTETIQLVNALKGTVSDATLLSQLPFIADVQAELEAVAAEKQANMALYSFGSFHTEDSEEVDA